MEVFFEVKHNYPNMEFFSGRNCHGYQKNTSPKIWIKIDANHASILEFHPRCFISN